MSRPNPQIEQLKRLTRPILEATGEHFCAAIDNQVNERLNNPAYATELDQARTAGLKLAIDIIRWEYRR